MAEKCEKVSFSIDKYSSFSSNYFPHNILEDRPTDQSSRWSSESNTPPEFIILKLDTLAIVKTICFGKYEKTHVCNLKKFKIYGGLKDNNMTEILESGLKNDHIPETFHVKDKIDCHYFPCKYIKIVPLQSWGTTFNFSVWYVELRGVTQPDIVTKSLQEFNKYKNQEAVRLCLKHLRQQNYFDAFDALQKKTKISLEHPSITEIHQKLVHEGDYEACEALIEGAAESGLFDHVINKLEFQPKWVEIIPKGKVEDSLRPGRRGGHQMCIDVRTETVYLFGGWDGKNDLADFWTFDIQSESWTCISDNTEDAGGPAACSCHKMVLDTERAQLFVLGRYVDAGSRSTASLESSFYMYNIPANEWTLITSDTKAMGGPPLIFDHQMVMDVEKHTIYVFGGRILCPDQLEDRNDTGLSGLYSYHVPTNTWTRLQTNSSVLKNRVGHSMLFHPIHRKIYIFSGQHYKENLTDFLAYDVDLDTASVVVDSTHTNATQRGGMPPVGFTHRSTLDPELNVIHVLLGLNRNKKDSLKNSLWIFNLNSHTWTYLYPNEANSTLNLSEAHSEPIPRFAHQLMYNHQKKVHYMFGGNPGADYEKNMRLDDLWALHLKRPSKDYVRRKCRFLIRKCKYLELVREEPVNALNYLQTRLSEVVNQKDSKELEEFLSLPSALFESSQSVSTPGEPSVEFVKRTELFDILVDFFPTNMAQPKPNLMDLISFV